MAGSVRYSQCKCIFKCLLFLAFLIHGSSQKSAQYILDPSVGLGRKFDGIGGISGGGATSKLLVNYPEPQRSQVLDYLFKPKFGAALQMLKVEIGGDSQSSEGTESSHMHEEWDENYQRGYEWWIMTEAKKRNPNIRIYGLPWGYPGWIGAGEWWPYHYPNNTATYIIKWVLGAKKFYNVTVDYVGIWNEKPYDKTYIKVLRQKLDESGLSHVQIVASDMLGLHAWDIADDLTKDPELNKSVSVIGGHYNGDATKTAIALNKPIWSSEDYSEENDENGGGCMARIVNQNYVRSYMTSTIAWNLIASYYDALPYKKKGLMTAQQPWSGYYQVESPIWTTAHTTQFTEIGWHYLKKGSGVGFLQGGGSYVSLLSPDGNDLTIVIETMDTSTHPFCVRMPDKPYQVKPQTATFLLKGPLVNITHLNVWHTKLAFGANSSYFKNLGTVVVSNGVVSMQLDVDSVYTLTTVKSGNKGSYGDPPPPGTFPVPYKDNFESYDVFKEANNFAQQVGVFEIRQSNDPQHGKMLSQVMLTAPVHWCPILQSSPVTVIGNFNWTDVSIEVDVNLNPVNKTPGAFIGVRMDQGGCTAFLANGLFLHVVPDSSVFVLSYDVGRTRPIASGPIPMQYGSWYRLGLSIKGNSTVATLDGKILVKKIVPMKSTNGFVALGTCNFGPVDFDNFVITKP